MRINPKPYFEAVLELTPPAQKVETPQLEVNGDDRYYAVTSQAFIPGVRRLRKLALQEDREEIWGALPSQQKWIELGIRAQPIVIEKNGENLNVQVSIALDEDRLETLIHQHDDLIVIHIHPAETTRQITKFSGAKPYHYYLEASALPSGADLVAMAKYSRGKILLFAIVSELGLTTFKMTPQGVNTEASEFIYSLYVEAALQRAQESDGLSSLERVRKACALLNSVGNFTVKFIPFVFKKRSLLSRDGENLRG